MMERDPLALRLATALEPILLPLARMKRPWGTLPRKVLNLPRAQLIAQYGPVAMRDFEARLTRIGPGDICLDLGANLGIFTQMMAATGAEVHAYEPDPHCFAALQKRFADRPNVHLHQKAVAHRSGTIALRRSKQFASDPDGESVVSSIVIESHRMDQKNTITVEMRSFTEIVQAFGRQVAVVKMDIEGAEFEILDQILAEQAQGRSLAIGALFIETHERFLTERIPMVRKLRQDNGASRLPYPIETYWP